MKKGKSKIDSSNDLNVTTDISAMPTEGMPKDAFQMVNYYGTYEIQPTADTHNQYPAIAQGYNPRIRKRDGQNKHHGHKFEVDDGEKF